MGVLVENADIDQLQKMRNDLILEKMRLDKFFTIFLDNAELDDDVDSPDWITYKEMLKDYNKVEDLIAIVCRAIGRKQ